MQTTEKKPLPATSLPEVKLGAWLVFAAGEIVQGVQWFALDLPSILIGRDAPSGIAVPADTRMSRRHATIHTGAGGRLSIVDEGSSNGTALNGKRIADHALKPGDVVSCGDSCLVIAELPAGVPDAAIDGLRGEAAAMRRLRATIVLLAPTPGTILIQAETGCGKELVARALHDRSELRGDFVAVNCAAIPEDLAESILFGHVTGAFTGASAQPGLFRAANHGTLFLDEVGELSQPIQAKLLRALEERAVRPVGATKAVPCAARVVAATHRDLADQVDSGSFRGDLYARLRELRVAIPPLRERREDILPLFAETTQARRRITHALAESLLVYRWPYNVRELLAVARELGIMSGGREPLDAPLFLERINSVQNARAVQTAPADDARALPSGASSSPGPSIDRAELERLLREHRGVVAKVAEAVARSRRQVYRWIEHHKIDVDAFR